MSEREAHAEADGNGVRKHVVTAHQVVKLAGPLNQWTYACSCGRKGNGWHDTPERAIERGGDHFRLSPAEQALRWLLLEGSVCFAEEHLDPVTVSYGHDWIAVPTEFHDLVKKVLAHDE